MTNYDAFVKDYLFDRKALSLEKIGSFIVTDVNPPDQKGLYQHLVTFKFDKKAETTPELIDYIAKLNGKSKILITSDLTTHFELVRQFINLGNSYEIEGAGSLRMTKLSDYEFIPYEFLSGKEDHKSLKKKQYASTFQQTEKKGNNKNALIFVAFLIIAGVLGIIGWGTYKLLISKNGNSTTDSLVTGNKVLLTPKNDSNLSSATNSNSKNSSEIATDTSNIHSNTALYKFVFEQTYSLERAHARIDQLNSFGDPALFDSVRTDSGMLYRLYIKKSLGSSDTTVIKDSLQKYFDRKVRIVPY